MNAKIGKQIKALRKKYDVTQDKLAEALGVTSQAVSKWENETGYPDIDSLIPIANFFNVTIDELFGHDTAGKERSIAALCRESDDLHRNYAPIDSRIRHLRQALAEFPAEEQLLVRLAEALWDKWQHEDFDRYSLINGRWTGDPEKYRAHQGWEEPVKILEELLSSSVDDGIRSRCRNTLIYLYGSLGEKEKVIRLADCCPNCRDRALFAAFSGTDEEMAKSSSQHLIAYALWLLGVHLPCKAAGPTGRRKHWSRSSGCTDLCLMTAITASITPN